MKYIIYPYKHYSASVKALAQTLRCRVMSLNRSKFRGNANTTVINWGNCTWLDTLEGSIVINHPVSVAITTNKLTAFQEMRDKVRIPRFSSDIEVAKGWLAEKEGRIVLSRTMTRASGGRGIVASTTEAGIVEAPLYVLYVRKAEEYRVHVAFGQVIDVQRKMRKREVAVDWRIRTHKNGFIFGREGMEVPDDVITQAIAAVKVMDLDFGAVDVIWQEAQQRAFVLEINTAPGLEGTTLDMYTNMFMERLL